MKGKSVSAVLALAALLAGCASTGEMVALDKRRLDVPEIDGSAPPVPLRVAVHVDRRVLKARIYSKNPTTGQVVQWGEIGPDVVNAFAEYAPKVFARAALAPRFPDEPMARGEVDAVLAVDFAIAEWAWSSAFGSELFNDTEVLVSIYAADGTLIRRYAAYGSGRAQRDGWNQERTMQELAAKKSAGVRPAVRAALLDFPTLEVLSHLARAAQAAESGQPSAWQRRREEHQAYVKGLQARMPAHADDGFEHNKRMMRIGAVAAGVGTATLGQMSTLGVGNPALNQATSLYVQQLMGNSEDFKLGLAAGQLGTALISLGGRGEASAAPTSGGGGRASYCQELLNMANQCRASQGSMASMPGMPRPGGRSGGGGGQAGAFNACYQNYMNAYKAACQ